MILQALENEEGWDPMMEFIAYKSCYYKPIESLLKKCPNIRRIDLIGFQTKHRNISKLMLQLITKYCNHLIDFKGISVNSNECESQEFCLKFGPKLKYFRSAKHVSDYNLFLNIESIGGGRVLGPIRVEDVIQLNELNHLKKLQFVISWNEEHLLPKMMQRFCKLTHLTLKLENKSLNKVFYDFPFQQNLKVLLLQFPDKQEIEIICDSLKQIAIKCPKLTRIKLISTIVLNDISEAEQLFCKLKAFPSLKRLDMDLVERTHFENNQWFSFELFKELPKITHLDLNCYSCEELNESVLKDIGIYLPNLQYFGFHTPLKIDTKGMTQMADILSRLSSLQTINLRFKRKIDYRSMKAMIIEKCPKIKAIQLLSYD